MSFRHGGRLVVVSPWDAICIVVAALNCQVLGRRDRERWADWMVITVQ